MDEVSGQCEACIKKWLESGGERSDAAKTQLLKLINKHPNNSLPRRYLARLLFHEAAGAISPGTVASSSSLQRIQLLSDAYEHAAVATNLSPNSLSCAALRATLAINLLVEESALLTPTPSTNATQTAGRVGSSEAAPAQQLQPAQQSAGCSLLDRKCQELLQRFLGSIDACKTALEDPNPVLREPLITFTTATHTTCDPCSLLVEKIINCSRAGKLEEVVAEKRSVLTSMQQVLQSCYALLDSTQVPLHNIIRLLQHILRPYGAEQQMLASSRINSSGSNTAAGSTSATQLPASQLHQAAIGELLCLLRPGANQAHGSAAGPATAPAAAPAAAPNKAGAAIAGPAARSCPPAVQSSQPAATAAAAAAARAQPELVPLPLSVDKPWDSPSAASTSPGGKPSAAGGRVASKGRAQRSSRSSGAAGGAAGKRRDRSRRERFQDVESFWRECSPQQRLQLLRVPLAPMLASVQQERGPVAAEVLMEGLVLLHEQQHSSCYWLCAACDRKFHTAREFNRHFETCHEQLVAAKPQGPAQPDQEPARALDQGTNTAGIGAQQQQQQSVLPAGSSSSNGSSISYVTCGKCKVPVVGMYYQRVSATTPSPQEQQPACSAAQTDSNLDHQHMCIRCFWEVAALTGMAAAEGKYTKVCPHAPGVSESVWSESASDFISTRGSFSSCLEDTASLGSPEECERTPAAGVTSGLQTLDHSGHGGCPAACRTPPKIQPHNQNTRQTCQLSQLQQQRVIAWSAHEQGTANFYSCSSSSSNGGVSSPQVPQQQQQHVPSHGHGMFVFGSKHNTTTTASSSGREANGALQSSAVVCAHASSTPADPSPVARTAAAAGCSMSEASSSTGAVHLQHRQAKSVADSLAAYWRQQQVLLCSTDAAAAELLEGLEILEQAKQLDSRQRRVKSTSIHTAGVPFSVSSSCSVQPATQGTEAVAAARQQDSQLPGGGAPGSARNASCTGASAQCVGGAAVMDADRRLARDGENDNAGAARCTAEHGDSAAASACDQTSAAVPSNRTWRDWLLPKKLMQWNEDDEQVCQDDLSQGSDDATDDVIVHTVDQRHAEPRGSGTQYACSSKHSQVHPPVSSVAGAGVGWQPQHAVHGASSGALGPQSDSPADGGLGSGSAPCSPRTPSACSSLRGPSGGVDVPGPGQQHLNGLLAVRNVATAAQAGGSTGADILDPCLAASGPRVLVDEVVRCMQHLYESDADIADETLLCLVDFVQRKLNPKGFKQAHCDSAAAAVLQADRRTSSGSLLRLEQISPVAAATAEAVGLSVADSALAAELLAAPELAFLSPRALQAAMCCLGTSDLHMMLAYIVRQSGTTLAGVSVEADSICGSNSGSATCTSASNSGSGSVTGDEELGTTESHSGSQASDEESGCMSLFQLHHLDEAAFEQLVAQLLPQEARPTQAVRPRGRQQPNEAPKLVGLTAASASNRGDSSSSGAAQKDRSDPVLLASPWWIEHLRQSSHSKDSPGDAQADLRVLRWVYGSVVPAQAEELAARQASLKGVLDRSAALLDLYERLADAWRRMQRVADRQRKLEHLRSRVKAKFADVRALEEVGQHASSQHAAAFLQALKHSLNSLNNKATVQTNTTADSATEGSAAASSASSVNSGTAVAAGDTQQDAAAAAVVAAATALSPMMQLTTYMTKLAPLYLCEGAVAAVREAPLLASEASKQYACALLERELAVLSLMEAKLDHEIAMARHRLQEANDRLAAKRGTELAAAEAEQSKLVADGPASHRRKDLLDKATKETEHRQKLAEVKARIEAAKAAIADDEALAAELQLFAAEGTASLLHAQDLARQMKLRLKTIQDFSGQFAALQPPLHSAALSASLRQRGEGGACTNPAGSSTRAPAASASGCVDGNASSGGLSPGGVQVAAGASSMTDAQTEWTHRARRLECLMCCVLWVADTIQLFDGQYDTANVAAANTSSSNSAAAATPASGQRRECSTVCTQAFSQTRTTPAEMLAASRWVKEQSEELNTSFHAVAEELGSFRSRIQQLACVDLTFEIHEAALAYVRLRIEAAAITAQEMRSQALLMELELEAQAKKAAAAAAGGGGGGGSLGSGSKQQQPHQPPSAAMQVAALESINKPCAANSQGPSAPASGATAKGAKGKKGKQEPKPAASKAAPKGSNKQRQQQTEQDAAAQEQAKKEAAERQQALEAARAAREVELEARRRELMVLEQAAEAELIRQAEEASLREQQLLKEAAEKECRRREQASQEAATAAAAVPARQSPIKASKGQISSATGPAGEGSQSLQGGHHPQRAQSGVAKAAAASALAAAGGGRAQPNSAGQSAPVSSAGRAVAQGTAARTVAAGLAAPVTAIGSAAGGVSNSSSTYSAKDNSSKQGQQQSAATAPGTSKKAGRGSQAAPAKRTTKSSTGPTGGPPTPSKQQRAQHKQQQQQQSSPLPQQQQPAPVLLDFGPTPAEAYSASQQHAGLRQQGDPEAVQEQHVQTHGMIQQQPKQQVVSPARQLFAATSADQHDHLQQQEQRRHHAQLPDAAAAAAEGATASSSGPHLTSTAGSSSRSEPLGLTAADAVVQMPSATVNSSSGLALLSSGPDTLSAAPSTSLGGVTSSTGMPCAAPGGPAPAASAAAQAHPAMLQFTPEFTPEALATSFSPAPGGSLLLGFGLGPYTTSRQGSAGFGAELNPTSSSHFAAQPAAVAMESSSYGLLTAATALCTPSSSVSLPSSAAAATQGVPHTSARPQVPSRSVFGISTTSSLHAHSGTNAGLDGPESLQVPPSTSSGFMASCSSGFMAQVPSEVHALGPGVEPSSPLLGSYPTDDVLHIQSIMSLLDEAGSAGGTTSGASAAAAATVGSHAVGLSGKGGRVQLDQHSKQHGKQAHAGHQQKQKQHVQQRNHNRTGCSSPGHAVAGVATSSSPNRRGLRAAASVGSIIEPCLQHTHSSASSSAQSTLSPLKPPGLSCATTSSLSSRPSTAGSTSTTGGDGLGGSRQRPQQQQQQHVKPTGHALGGDVQLWGGFSGGAAASAAAQNYSSSSWGMAGAQSADAAAAASVQLSNRTLEGTSRLGVACGTAADSSGIFDPSAGGGGGSWGSTGAAMHHRAVLRDAAATRDQYRQVAGGPSGLPPAAAITRTQNHLASTTAAAAAAAAVRQTKQHATGYTKSDDLQPIANTGVPGFNSYGHASAATLFGGSAYGYSLPVYGALPAGRGHSDGVAGYTSGLSGALGINGADGGAAGVFVPGAGPAAAGGLLDVSGLWQQHAAGTGQSVGASGVQQQQQQMMMWRLPSDGSLAGHHGVQW